MITALPIDNTLRAAVAAGRAKASFFAGRMDGTLPMPTDVPYHDEDHLAAFRLGFAERAMKIDRHASAHEDAYLDSADALGLI